VAGIDQAKGADCSKPKLAREAVQAEFDFVLALNVNARKVFIRVIRLLSRASKPPSPLRKTCQANLLAVTADLNQARTMLRSSELAAEAERLSKAVLESQGMQTSGRSAREAGEPCGSLREHWLHQDLRSGRRYRGANDKFESDNSSLPGAAGDLVRCSPQKWVQANFPRKPS